MAITVPTFAFGRRPTQAELKQLADALSALKNPPHCLSYVSAATTSVPSGTTTSIGYDADILDTDTIHDPVTNNTRFTAKTAGRYLLCAQGSVAANATGYRIMQFRLNGVTNLQQTINLAPPATTAAIECLSMELAMAVNDYVEVRFTQNSGSTLATVAGAISSTTMYMLKVSE